MKIKHLRIVATSLLLFQNGAFPIAAFAEETPTAVDTKVVKQLQNQMETPVTQAETSSETNESTTTLSEEPATTNENEESAKQETTNTQETTDKTNTTPTVEESQPSEEPIEAKVTETTEESNVSVQSVQQPINVESYIPMALKEPRASGLPNLPAYRNTLKQYGQSSYIDQVLKNVFNQEIILGATIGATQTVKATFNTYSTIKQSEENGWVSMIASDKYDLPELYYKYMYYGNHPKYSNTYKMTNLVSFNASPYISVQVTSSVQGTTMTVEATVTRTKATAETTGTFSVKGNVTLGTRAVSEGAGKEYTKVIEDVSYSDVNLGTVKVKNEQAEPVINSSVTVEAQREKELSQDIIKSWFTTLPANPDNYNYTILQGTGPSTWRPGDSGEVTVSIKDKGGDSSLDKTFTTNYTVVDTKAPTGKLKEGLSYEEGSEEPDLHDLLDGDPQDNWSLPENIQLSLTFDNGKQFSELPVGENHFTLTLTDEAGNERLLQGTLTITDKITIWTQVTIQARRTKDLPDSIVRSWFIDLPNEPDNWSYTVLGHEDWESNTNLEEWAPNTGGWLTVRVKNKNTNETRDLKTYCTVEDKKEPTGKLKEGLSYEEGSEEPDLHDLLDGDPQDNWSLPENIQLSLTFDNGKQFSELSVGENHFTLTLTDEAGNEGTLQGTLTITDKITIWTAVTIQPTRTKDLPESVIRSWFIDLPNDPDNWSYTITGHEDWESNPNPEEWAPNTDGWLNVYVKNKSTNETRMLSTYCWVDEDKTPPTGKLKEGLSYEEGSEEPDLHDLLDGDPQDNWSLPENIQLSLTFDNGKQFSELPVGENHFTLTLTDEAGNEGTLQGTLTITDKITIWTQVTIQARRTKDLPDSIVRSWFIDLPNEPDNWSYIVLGHEDWESNTNLEEWAPNTGGWLTVRVKNKNTNETRDLKTYCTVEDKKAPTGKLKEGLSYEEGSEEPDLHDLLDGDPQDNWSLPENIQLSLSFDNGKQFSELPVGENHFTLTLTDEAGNEGTLQGTLTIFSRSQYIDVTVPVKTEFAQNKSSDGIVSPIYKIQNHSERSISVFIDSVTNGEHTESLTDLTLGMKNTQQDQSVLLVSHGQTLSESTPLTTLSNETGTYEFSFFGSAGNNISLEDLLVPIKPTYMMNLRFEVNKEE